MPPDSAGIRFRATLKQGITVMPGVFSAITAQLAEQAGFRAVYLTGAGVTNSLTGYPDIGLLTLTEMAQQSRYVSRATSLPVIADADTGYGEIHNITRTVEEFETAGLAGIHIEDQVAPKRCGHLDGKQIISPVDMARKIRAASTCSGLMLFNAPMRRVCVPDKYWLTTRPVVR